MNIVVTVQATLAKRLRNARQLLGWFGWLFRLAGVGFVVWGLFGGDGFFVGLVLVVYPELLGLIRHLVARKLGTQWVYTLRDGGIGVENAVSTLDFSWAAVKSVRETRAEWVLRIEGAGLISLPKTAIAPEADATWRAFLQRRQLIAA